MNHRRTFVWLAVMVTCWTMSVSAQEASRPRNPQERRQALIKRFDKDGDGRLGPEERRAAQKELVQRGVDEIAARLLPPGVKGMRDVEYARIDGRPLRLDLYLPTSISKPVPVIVYIHGGAWRAGSKATCPIVQLAGKGFAIVSIDYRLTDTAAFPAQIHDCKGAIRWVRAHAKEYGLDSDRVGVWGNSAGGHLVALLGTSGGIKELEGNVGGNLEYSSRVQAVADFCGPTSFRLEDLKGLEGAGEGKTPLAVVSLLGGTVQEKAELARQASPTSFVSPDDPPFFIAHGERDPIVPVSQARILAAALKKTNVDVTLHIDPEADHGVGRTRAREMAEDFFSKQFKVKASTSMPSR